MWRRSWLALRMAWWILALPVLKRVMPLPTLVARARSRPGTRTFSREQIGEIIAVTSRVYQVLRFGKAGNCLERSLVNYHFLSGSVPNLQLVIGVRRLDQRIVGHAWVTVDGQVLGENPASINSYVQVIRFDGSAVPTRPSEPVPNNG
ncbi:MAG TPA: lasso peptide biosynthesis B2 protein [Chloroflexota bacterium]|nr:lasso peptide biosynthesis B2 protein [Chloroflexota bacterium]